MPPLRSRHFGWAAYPAGRRRAHLVGGHGLDDGERKRLDTALVIVERAMNVATAAAGATPLGKVPEMNSHDAVRALRRMMGGDHSQLLRPW
jgi:hypothetical protein